MKDFNAWLADTTEYLRADEGPTVDELRSIAEALRKNRAPKVDDHYIIAAPDPCTVCGSAEEVCECEEAEYQRECEGVEFRNTDGSLWARAPDPIPDLQFPRLYRAGLWQDAEGTIPVRKGDPVGRVECPLMGNAMTSPEGSGPTYREPMTVTGHALQTYVVRFLQDMARRRRGGDE